MPTAITPPVLFKCLADETRARVMLLVAREQELCVCELTCALQASQPKISRHLAVLRQSGLLQERRQGQWVYYSLPAELPAWVTAVLHTSLEANSDWLENNLQYLQDMGDRPVRLSRCC